MSISRVQHKIATGTGSNPTATFTSSTTTGNLLVAVINTASGVTVSGFGGWTLAASNTTGSDAVWVYYLPNAASTTVVSATLSGSARWIMQVGEYSGISATSPLDQAATTSQALTTTGVSPNATTTNANEVVIAFFCLDDDSGTFGLPTNSFTTVDSAGVGSYPSLLVADLIVSSTATYSTSVTYTVTANWNSIIVSFSATGGSSTPSPRTVNVFRVPFGSIPQLQF